jgi:hypothetical protein
MYRVVWPLNWPLQCQYGKNHERLRCTRIGHESLETANLKSRGLSASHTINGHSIVFRLTYGRMSYLFSGDLNDEAGRFLTREHNSGKINLKAEVFKVPHLGSADFSGAFIQAVAASFPAVTKMPAKSTSTRARHWSERWENGRACQNRWFWSPNSWLSFRSREMSESPIRRIRNE